MNESINQSINGSIQAEKLSAPQERHQVLLPVIGARAGARCDDEPARLGRHLPMHDVDGLLFGDACTRRHPQSSPSHAVGGMHPEGVGGEDGSLRFKAVQCGTQPGASKREPGGEPASSAPRSAARPQTNRCGVRPAMRPLVPSCAICSAAETAVRNIASRPLSVLVRTLTPAAAQQVRRSASSSRG